MSRSMSRFFAKLRRLPVRGLPVLFGATLCLPLWAAENKPLATAAKLSPLGQAEIPTREAAGAPRRSAPGGRGAELSVDFTQPPRFTAHLSQAGLRLTVDVPGAAVKGAPAAIAEGQGVIAGVMIQAFEKDARSTTRILVTFSEPAEHSVTVVGRRLLVRATPLGEVLPPVVRALGDTQAKAPRRPLQVSDVRFERQGDLNWVRIESDGAPEFRRRELSETSTRLELSTAALAEELERALDVRAFGSPVKMVSSYRHGNRVFIDVEHEVGVESIIRRQGNALLWELYDGPIPSSVSGVAADGKAARRTRTILTEDILGKHRRPAGGAPETSAETSELAELQSAPDQAAALTPGVLGQNQGRYTGRRVDIDLKDADVHNVLRLLADVGRRNIITADNVGGTVTIRMRNVPWDQALAVVLQAKGLGQKAHGNIIRVAPLDELEKEREMEIERMRQELKLAPLETRLIPVSYAEAARLQDRARDLLSGRGSIAVDERTNVMIVRDVAGNLDQIEELTRSLDTQTPQVLIEARIVEATSRYLRDIDIQWGGDASFSPSTGNPTGLAFPNSIGLAGGASDGQTPTAGLSAFQNTVANPNFAVNLPAAAGTGSGGALGLTFGSVDSNFNLNLRLSAAETSGLLRVLSSPRVLTLDNSKAQISQGTLIPFSQVSAQGVQTTFQEAKLQLLVQPHVTADGSVSMQVKINRDEPDFNQTSARGDPTILKRQAETNLLVADGHTAVIGGIYTRNTGRNVDQVPFFGDIPLLGLLFQHRTASDQRGELVIFLTPRIVNRAEALGR
jgi:type IV pilus assembly protein PilQ